ncbi:MAG: serine hydroxymethyltransferase, partial [Gammaproteobacteria bacterium]|nr:serine hydroxymethyltransferase [Gammaproteobacteria bacterium]
MSDYFHSGVALTDPLIGDALARELHRQQTQIELIASENIVSQAVLDALAHPITNKTLEGYPGHRFHGGGEFVDIVEQAAIDRAKELFNCNYANVQPHSGTQANQAVFFATVKPGDKILSLNLAAGGHLSHGAAPNLSGRWFDSHHYGVDKDSGLIDYDEAERLAKAIRPKLLIAGGSAYPRIIDFERLGFIAKSVDALLLVDMAHFAGLVAAGVHPSPLPFADIVTCTTTKTMRGPRGGIILARESSWAKKLQSAIFPGVQGSLHSQIIAAKAVCLGEALGDDFKGYGRRVIDNAKTLARVLLEHGIKLVSGGTDTHMVLLDFSSRNLTGQQ